MSVKSHLTSGVSVCSENTVTYSAGNGEGFSLKMLRSKVMASLATVAFYHGDTQVF